MSGLVAAAVISLASGAGGFTAAWWAFRDAAVQPPPPPPAPESVPEPWTPTVAHDACGTWLQGLTDLDREVLMGRASERDAAPS